MEAGWWFMAEHLRALWMDLRSALIADACPRAPGLHCLISRRPSAPQFHSKSTAASAPQFHHRPQEHLAPISTGLDKSLSWIRIKWIVQKCKSQKYLILKGDGLQELICTKFGGRSFGPNLMNFWKTSKRPPGWGNIYAFSGCLSENTSTKEYTNFTAHF